MVGTVKFRREKYLKWNVFLHQWLHESYFSSSNFSKISAVISWDAAYSPISSMILSKDCWGYITHSCKRRLSNSSSWRFLSSGACKNESASVLSTWIEIVVIIVVRLSCSITVKSIVDKYLNCIEEIINVPVLLERFEYVKSQGYLTDVLLECYDNSLNTKRSLETAL